jgi:hypothetical protein
MSSLKITHLPFAVFELTLFDSVDAVETLARCAESVVR